MGAHPSPGSVKYMLWGRFGPPKKKKKCKPFLGKKPNTPLFISVKQGKATAKKVLGKKSCGKKVLPIRDSIF